MAHPATEFHVTIARGADQDIELEVKNAAGALFDPTGYTFLLVAESTSGTADLFTLAPTFENPAESVALFSVSQAQSLLVSVGRKSRYAMWVTSPAPETKTELAFYGFMTGLSVPRADV